ncbi:hypothetical protein BJ508DRAFT_315814 [Ascobolus immersus RN42]|uniref:Uncharacterized protein n=1 Tax=Ascobolus immersus RN42 TaxID=1160509 RepID=A0A3N4H941_ASCIM|nr:hypothetical protein BJ508DRAFT_315814 [Ascobolus immersus RN42]
MSDNSILQTMNQDTIWGVDVSQYLMTSRGTSGSSSGTSTVLAVAQLNKQRWIRAGLPPNGKAKCNSLNCNKEIAFLDLQSDSAGIPDNTSAKINKNDDAFSRPHHVPGYSQIQSQITKNHRIIFCSLTCLEGKTLNDLSTGLFTITKVGATQASGSGAGAGAKEEEEA